MFQKTFYMEASILDNQGNFLPILEAYGNVKSKFDAEQKKRTLESAARNSCVGNFILSSTSSSPLNVLVLDAETNVSAFYSTIAATASSIGRLGAKRGGIYIETVSDSVTRVPFATCATSKLIQGGGKAQFQSSASVMNALVHRRGDFNIIYLDYCNCVYTILDEILPSFAAMSTKSIGYFGITYARKRRLPDKQHVVKIGRAHV